MRRALEDRLLRDFPLRVESTKLCKMRDENSLVVVVIPNARLTRPPPLSLL